MFQFENMWLLKDNFTEHMRIRLNDNKVNGSYSHCVVETFTAIKKEPKVQDKEVFGNVSFINAKAFSHVHYWKTKERESIVLEEVQAKKEVLEDYK